MSTPYTESQVMARATIPIAVEDTGIEHDEAQARRILTICNACRYCEGFCAVFPAMTRRLDFVKEDVHYLANLCHNCGACLHACQYAAPHEFDVNIPRTLAKVRLKTYSEYAWPRALGQLYDRNGLTLSLATAVGLSLFLALLVWLKGALWHAPLQGNFYAIFPHNLLVAMFGLVFLYAALALGIGATRFWRGTRKDAAPPSSASGAAAEASFDVLTLRYLGGGHGEGCNEESARFTLWRRRFHHMTFYGFMLCFAATGVATVYHYALGWQAPYPVLSLPVLLGTAGGIGLLIGPAGLYLLNRKRHADHGDPAQHAMDRGFMALLFFVSLTGLLLLALRDTSWMAVLLAVHLGFVMAFFLTMPYGKFAHGIYRSAALLKNAVEKRTPGTLNVGAD
ncbi:tricarballylate utilization 4Fe-4S protein TcuB [Bordetella parapertussis]|uniref:Citrate utilization protein B n=2 Tax=Bordetella parapertussis TaxID=519 RepID=Q7W5X6_BORPA|nr:tricarballylate utilization 4Fe-4S protein TcuB [Bordetella parapertussis]AOB40137.1 tricarballylate utilization protein B [Bordetella parapertussis]AUL44154.1 tricarballylate utilization protein B [Bordetella parapertussis]AWP64058.1 tricarballylate utilization protein B [Bordetella parapertussis]AWP71562.1 tricarballylate utilization protein B [Bordetella parapertussis]AWP90167.1 tricarballylate utilization protein B [Bordetella parapertussis]